MLVDYSALTTLSVARRSVHKSMTVDGISANGTLASRRARRDVRARTFNPIYIPMNSYQFLIASLTSGTWPVKMKSMRWSARLIQSARSNRIACIFKITQHARAFARSLRICESNFLLLLFSDDRAMMRGRAIRSRASRHESAKIRQKPTFGRMIAQWRRARFSYKRRSPTSVVSAFLHAARIGGILICARCRECGNGMGNCTRDSDGAFDTTTIPSLRCRRAALAECDFPWKARPDFSPPTYLPSFPFPTLHFNPTSGRSVAPCMCCNPRARVVDYLFGLNGKEFTLERDRVRGGSAEFFARDYATQRTPRLNLPLSRVVIEKSTASGL